MILIDEFEKIFSKALIRLAEQSGIGKSMNQILIMPDKIADDMQLLFFYCCDNEEGNGYLPLGQITWETIYGEDDFIMNRNMMMASFFLQTFIRLGRENKCPPEDIKIMVVFENDDSEHITLFAYNGMELLTDFDTKLKKSIPIDEIFMDIQL